MFGFEKNKPAQERDIGYQCGNGKPRPSTKDGQQVLMDRLVELVKKISANSNEMAIKINHQEKELATLRDQVLAIAANAASHKEIVMLLFKNFPVNETNKDEFLAVLAKIKRNEKLANTAMEEADKNMEAME